MCKALLLFYTYSEFRMTLIRFFSASFFISLLLLSFSSKALDITFINPGFADEPTDEINTTGNFWFKVSKLMLNAANDLEINLHIEYADRNHILMKELIRQAVKNNPDYLVLVDETNVVSDYLSKINTKNIPIYFLYSRPSITKLNMLKSQGVNIIGSVVPDNHVAGKNLAKQLVMKHNTSSKQPARLFALLGHHTTPASVERTAGLTEFINKNQDVTFIGKEVANWSEQESYVKTLAFMQLMPEINIIWSANDAIGFGAKRALQELNKEDRVLVGGVNWDTVPHGVEALDITFGGHVLLGAYALITLFDHHAENTKFGVTHSSLAIFEQLKPTILPLAKHINDTDLAKIDFSQFSKTSSNWQPFTIENLLKALDK